MSESSQSSPGRLLAALAMKAGRRLGTGWLLLLVASQAGAADQDPTTYGHRIQQ